MSETLGTCAGYPSADLHRASTLLHRPAMALAGHHARSAAMVIGVYRRRPRSRPTDLRPAPCHDPRAGTVGPMVP